MYFGCYVPYTCYSVLCIADMLYVLLILLGICTFCTYNHHLCVLCVSRHWRLLLMTQRSYCLYIVVAHRCNHVNQGLTSPQSHTEASNYIQILAKVRIVLDSNQAYRDLRTNALTTQPCRCSTPKDQPFIITWRRKSGGGGLVKCRWSPRGGAVANKCKRSQWE